MARFREFVRLGVRNVIYGIIPSRSSTMRNGTGIATRVLLVNSVIAVFAFVAQVTSLATCGASHQYSTLYMVLMLVMFVASLVAQWVVRKSLLAGMNFYAWICLACVAGMAFVDATVLETGFSMILFVLTLGVLGLGLTVGYQGSIPYAAVSSILILAIGTISHDLDNAIVATTLIAATAAMSSESAHTAKRLDYLETAVGAYIDAKREYREEHG